MLKISPFIIYIYRENFLYLEVIYFGSGILPSNVWYIDTKTVKSFIKVLEKENLNWRVYIKSKFKLWPGLGQRNHWFSINLYIIVYTFSYRNFSFVYKLLFKCQEKGEYILDLTKIYQKLRQKFGIFNSVQRFVYLFRTCHCRKEREETRVMKVLIPKETSYEVLRPVPNTCLHIKVIVFKWSRWLCFP